MEKKLNGTLEARFKQNECEGEVFDFRLKNQSENISLKLSRIKDYDSNYRYVRGGC